MVLQRAQFHIAGARQGSHANGVVIGAGGLLLKACGGGTEPSVSRSSQAPTAFSAPDPTVYYPPALTGMRGSHEGSFEVAHALACRGEKPEHYTPLNEHYDLVVVGAGMSGLAAAWYYRKKMGPDVRVLVLDNHDDFGGHAKRNEFHSGGRMILSLGGAQNLESPRSYSEVAGGLLVDIGIDEDFIALMDANTPENLALAGRLHADNGVALPGPDGHVTTGGNWNAVMFGGDGYQETVRALPLPEAERDKLAAFFGGTRDFLDGLSLSEKWDYVNSVSYNQFLVERVGLAVETVPILNAIILHLTGLSGWNLTVLEAMSSGATGIRAMGWLGQMSGRDQLRVGRHKIYATPFASYEQQIREQLQSMLGKHGFDHETDIRAITVNRVPHGYAYPYLGLDDPDWAEGQAPHEVGRAQFGRISIANTDSEAIALMEGAFDAAWRAVEEQAEAAMRDAGSLATPSGMNHLGSDRVRWV